MKEQLSVIIITRNEESEIEECLESVSWADEIVLVDSNSTDRTVEIAKRFTDRVVTRDFTGFTDQKRYATSLAAGPWILNIDADERVGEALKSEIISLLDRDPSANGYAIPRLTWYIGRFIRHSGWYPDRKLRLFRKERGEWRGGRVHESLHVDGPVEIISQPILHYSFRTLDDHFRTIDHFTRLGAEDLIDRGRAGNLFDLLLRPPFTFLRCLVLRFGFLDGWRGFLIASLSAKHTWLKYWRARKMERQRKQITRNG